MIDPTEHSISEILDWIRTSRIPSAHPKAQERTKGGYSMTLQGYNQWTDDALFLLNYVANKDNDRYDDFLKRYKDIDPIGFNALVGRMYHTEEQQEEDVTALVPTTAPPPTTTLAPPPTTTTTLPPPSTTTTTMVPTTTVVPTTTTAVPPTTTYMIPPTTTRPQEPSSIWPKEEDARYGTQGGARPHSPHAPFWPRRPADWPYAKGPKYGEMGEDDLTLNIGPDDWGAPPGTAAAPPPEPFDPAVLANVPRTEMKGWPEAGPLKIIGDFLTGYFNPGQQSDISPDVEVAQL